MKKGPVFLVGMMGAGKSSLGNLLAIQSGLPFLDTDAWIEAKTGKTISEIFEQQGELAFRTMEMECFAELKSEKQWIATGGGFPCFNDLMEKMKTVGTVIYLKLSADELFVRLKNQETRPLLQSENPIRVLHQLLTERSEIYEKADHVLNGNQALMDLVHEIESLDLI